MNKKKLTVATIITDKTYFLAVHPTKGQMYEIPKGLTDPTDKSTLETAIREVQEETGLDISNKKLITIGQFDYNDEKDIFVYLLITTLPKISSLNCTSWSKTIQDFEIDEFKYVKFEHLNELEKYFKVPIFKILMNVYNNKLHLEKYI